MGHRKGSLGTAMVVWEKVFLFVPIIVKMSLFVGVRSTREGSRKCCLHVSYRPLGEDGQARSHRRPRSHARAVEHMQTPRSRVLHFPLTLQQPRTPDPARASKSMRVEKPWNVTTFIVPLAIAAETWQPNA